MQSIGSINIIENFISKDTCNFLISEYKNSFKENAETKNNIHGGHSVGIDHAFKIGPGKFAFPFYNSDSNNNIATDLTTNIINSICREISDFYKERVDPRSIFFSKMLEGSFLNKHYDNYLNDGKKFYPYGSNPEIIEKIGFKEDYSALLYLNNDYQGGEIEFPQENLILKPEPGTLIFFKGNQNSMHGVNEIIKGERINIVSFYWSTEYHKEYFKEFYLLGELSNQNISKLS